jgi:hypothetical protein
MQNIKTNHGWICQFYASSVSAHQVPLPAYKSKLEELDVFVHGARRNTFIIILYAPGSAVISNAFFDDIVCVIERLLTFASPV